MREKKDVFSFLRPTQHGRGRIFLPVWPAAKNTASDDDDDGNDEDEEVVVAQARKVLG